MKRTDETAGLCELLILRGRGLERVRHVGGIVCLVGEAARLPRVEAPHGARLRTQIERRERVDLPGASDGVDRTEDALRLVDARAVVRLNALPIRFDNSTRGGLLLENRLLDLRYRCFLHVK